MKQRGKFLQMSNYEQNIIRVCDYINQNLDDDLTLDMLSEVSGFSKYHFHRIFFGLYRA